MNEHNRKLRQYRILKSDVEKDLPREQLLTNAFLAFYGKASYQDLDTAHRYYERYKHIELAYKNNALDQLLIDMPIIKKITQDQKNGSYIAAHTAIAKIPYERYAQTMTVLGAMYANGQCVPKDDARAFQLFQKAANLGNTLAMRNLGVMYAKGQGVPKDDARACQLYQKAANLGDPWAMYNLGVMYENGQGVPKDDSRAFQLFQKAANLGNAWAMTSLGTMYARALGLPKNIPQAIHWLQRAVDAGFKPAIKQLQQLQKQASTPLASAALAPTAQAAVEPAAPPQDNGEPSAKKARLSQHSK